MQKTKSQVRLCFVHNAQYTNQMLIYLTTYLDKMKLDLFLL